MILLTKKFDLFILTAFEQTVVESWGCFTRPTCMHAHVCVWQNFSPHLGLESESSSLQTPPPSQQSPLPLPVQFTNVILCGCFQELFFEQKWWKKKCDGDRGTHEKHKAPRLMWWTSCLHVSILVAMVMNRNLSHYSEYALWFEQGKYRHYPFYPSGKHPSKSVGALLLNRHSYYKLIY